MEIDTEYFQRLFRDLNDISRQYNYQQQDLIYFYEFAELLAWLHKEQPEIFNSNSSYWIDEAKINLRILAEEYLQISKEVFLDTETENDIPLLNYLVNDMLLELKSINSQVRFVDITINNTNKEFDNIKDELQEIIIEKLDAIKTSTDFIKGVYQQSNEKNVQKSKTKSKSREQISYDNKQKLLNLPRNKGY